MKCKNKQNPHKQNTKPNPHTHTNAVKCNLGPESETIYAESVGLSKLILHKISFQFLFVTIL